MTTIPRMVKDGIFVADDVDKGCLVLQKLGGSGQPQKCSRDT